MKLTYTKTEIENLIKNPKLYLDLLERTHGFLYEKTISVGVEVPTEIVDTLKLSDFGRALLGFRDSTASKMIELKDLPIENLDEILEFKEPLELMNIKDINDNAENILTVSMVDNSKVYYPLWDYLTKSISNLSYEDFLKVDSRLLITKLNLFDRWSSKYSDLSYKNKFKDCISNFDKVNGFKQSILNYKRYYHFDKSDMPFLEDLLSDENSEQLDLMQRRDYRNLSSLLRGFSNMISPEDYILKYNPLDLSCVKEEFIESNLDVIRVNYLSKQLKKYKDKELSLSEILLNNGDPAKIFKLVVSKEIIESLVKNIPKISLRTYGAGTDINKASKLFYIYDSLFDLSNEGKIILPTYHTYDSYRELVDSIEQDDLIKIKEDFCPQIDFKYGKFIENSINDSLKNDNLQNILDEFSILINDKNFDICELITDNVKPSVNLFYLTSYTLSELIKSNKNNRTVNDSINKLSKINSELFYLLKDDNPVIKDVITKMSLSNYILDKAEIIFAFKNEIDDSKNFLKLINSEDLLSPGMVNLLSLYTELNLFNRINMREISLKDFEDDILYNRFSSLESNKVNLERLSFCNNFIKNNIDEISKNSSLYRKIIKHPNQKIIYPEISLDKQYISYNDAVLLGEKLKDINVAIGKCKEKLSKVEINEAVDPQDILINKDLDIKNIDFDNEDKEYIKECLKSLNYIYEQSHIELEKNINSITLAFLNQKCLELLNDNQFEIYQFIIKLSRNVDEFMFEDFVNDLTLKEQIELFNNQTFCKLINGTISYEGTTNIRLKPMAKQEIKSCVDIFEKFNSSKSIKYLNIFEDSNEELKKFIIEEIPDEILANYSFLHFQKEKNTHRLGFRKSVIKSPYTVDEVVRVFNNINSMDLYFTNHDINARPADNISQFFDHDESLSERFNKVSSVLEQLSRGNEIAYLMVLTDSTVLDILADSMIEDTKNMTRDEIYHNTFVKIANLDSINLGIRKCFEKLNNNPKEIDVNSNSNNVNKYNQRMIKDLINNICFLTYSESPDNGQVESKLSYKDSVKLLNTFYEYDPLFAATNIKAVGVIDNVINHLSSNFDDLLKDKNIDILLTKNDLSHVYVGYSYIEKRIFNLYENLINYLVEKNEVNDLEYLKYCLNLVKSYEDYEVSDEIRNKSEKLCQLNKNDFRVLSSLVNDGTFLDRIDKTIDMVSLSNQIGRSDTKKRGNKI